MISINIDGESIQVADMSIDQLEYAVEKLSGELDRKRLLRDAERESERLAIRYLTARDGQPAPGEEPPSWIQPQGSFDAYPVDYQVIHEGKVWRNLTPFNVWSPPTGWREVVEGTPEWVRPTGAHDAYSKGDRVMFQGFEFISKIDANVHSPHEYPPGWEVYSEPDPVEGEDDLPPAEEDPIEPPTEDPEPPVDDPDPEPPVEEPEYPAWSPWDHIGPLYQIGDRVTHNGRSWEATADNNHWEPGEYGWEDIGPA